jgi:hypothetical protein
MELSAAGLMCFYTGTDSSVPRHQSAGGIFCDAGQFVDTSLEFAV